MYGFTILATASERQHICPFDQAYSYTEQAARGKMDQGFASRPG